MIQSCVHFDQKTIWNILADMNEKKAFVQICDKTNHMVYTRFI